MFRKVIFTLSDGCLLGLNSSQTRLDTKKLHNLPFVHIAPLFNILYLGNSTYSIPMSISYKLTYRQTKSERTTRTPIGARSGESAEYAFPTSSI